MQAIFYKFSKKANSTATPTGGTTLSVVLKDETSVLAPALELHTAGYPDYNYCYIPEFSRFYFCRDWAYNKGVWTSNLTVDVAASYKAEINDYTAFVERASASYDSDLIDSQLSIKQSIADISRTFVRFPHYDGDGCYIVRIAGAVPTESAPTGIFTYAMSGDTLGNLLSYLYDSDNFSDIFAEVFVKAVFNPIKYIISAKWFPIELSYVGGRTARIQAGFFDTGISARLLEYTGAYVNTRIPVPARFYNDARDLNPLNTRFSLYIPSFGLLDLAPEVVYKTSEISIQSHVDYTTGQISSILLTDNTQIITSLVGQVGFDIQIGSTSENVGNVLTGVASTVANMIGGNVIGAVVGGVESVKNVLTPNVSTVGSTGSIEGFKGFPEFYLTRTIYDTAEYPTAVAGRPLMRNVKLNTLTGYVKCGNASLNINGYSSERDELNTMLNSGIYLE